MGTTSELEVIIAFAVSTLLTVPGMVHVYDYEPVAKAGDAIPLFLKEAGWIDYWWIEAVSTQEAWLTNREILLTHDLVFHGYGEVQDAAVSGPAFRVLTTRIADTFRPQYKIPNPMTAELLGPMQTPVRGQLILLHNTFLVHHSEMHLRATERVTLT